MGIPMAQLSLESSNTTLTTYKYVFMTRRKSIAWLLPAVCVRNIGNTDLKNWLMVGRWCQLPLPDVDRDHINPRNHSTMTQTHLADMSAPSEELSLLWLTQSVLSGLYSDTRSNRMFKNYQNFHGLKYRYYTSPIYLLYYFRWFLRRMKVVFPPIEKRQIQ